jgi:calcium-dependent protein kinase
LSTETEEGIFSEIMEGKLDFTSDPWPSISLAAKDLVRKMLRHNVKERLTAHQVLSKTLLFMSII